MHHKICASPMWQCANCCSALALEQILLVFFLRPLVRVGGRGLSLDERLPRLRELAVERDEFLLRVGHVVLGEDRLDRALRHAQRAVDALVGVDHQHVRPLAEAVDRADVDAVRVFALDAAFGDDVSHFGSRVYHGGSAWPHNGGLPARPQRRAMSSPAIQHVTDDTFDPEVLKSDTPVLVDYWAEWCGPCKSIAPLLDQIAQEYAGRLKVAKLNIDENQATPAKYGIRSIPTLMIFKNGEVEATKTGAVPKPQLMAFIDSNI